MTTAPCWTIANVFDYGDSKHWGPVSRKSYSHFRRQYGIPAIKAWGVAARFVQTYRELAACTPDERHAIAALPHDQARELLAVTTAARLHAAAKATRLRAEAEAVARAEAVEQHRGEQCWRLTCGFRGEDLYTLDQIEAWRGTLDQATSPLAFAWLGAEAVDTEGNMIAAVEWAYDRALDEARHQSLPAGFAQYRLFCTLCEQLADYVGR